MFAPHATGAEFETSTGPHAQGQRNRRQEAARLCMSVRTEFRLLVNLQELDPVPQRRHRITCARMAEHRYPESRRARPSASR